MEPQQSLKSWNVEFNSENGRSSSPSQHCGSANQNTQLHNIISHGTITPQTISHFTAPPIRLYQMSINAKTGGKDHHQRMVARADTNQCCRHVTYNVAKSIHIARVLSANMTHLTKISVVNHKQHSNDIIDPLFLWYLQVGSVKVEPQWAKYPNLSVRSFVTSKKPILEF
jgi:hypothetical protein